MVMAFQCKFCISKFKSIQAFILHLSSSKHTTKAQKKHFDSNEDLCIIADGYRQNKGKRARLNIIQVLTHFYQYEMINALPYHDRCIVQFATSKQAQSVLSKEHNVRKVKIKVYPLAEMDNEPSDGQVNTTMLTKDLSEDLRNRMKNVMNMPEVETCLIDITNQIRLSPQELNDRQSLMRKVLQVLDSVYPGCNIFAFGSSVNGLGFSGCDLDLCTNVGSISERQSSAKLTIELSKIIKRAKMAYNITAISKAKVPIVKFVDNITDVHVDLSFSSALPHYNTHLIKAYVENNIIRPYVMILRYWAKIENISGGGNPFQLITNYAFTLMCIFHLMVRKDPIVPPLSVLQSEYHRHNYQPIMIDGWDCSYVTDVPIILRRSITTMELVYEFFQFYSILDTAKYAISPMIGGLIDRRGMQQTGDKTPSELHNNCKRGSPFQWGLMNVQDPFILSANLTKSLKGPRRRNFQELCKTAAEVCKKILDKQTPLWQLFDRGERKVSRPKPAVVEQLPTENKTDSGTMPKPPIVAETKLKPISKCVYHFSFHMVQQVKINADGTVTKGNDDSLMQSAENLIVIALEKCLMAQVHRPESSGCSERMKNCILKNDCYVTIHLDLSKHRNKTRKKIPDLTKDPFAREVETTKMILTIFKEKTLILSNPLTFSLHLCEQPNNKRTFEVVCLYPTYIKSVLPSLTLFSSVVSLVTKKLAMLGKRKVL